MQNHAGSCWIKASKDGDDVSLKGILSFLDAMMFNNPSTVRILLSHPDTRLDIADHNGWTALHYICAASDVECIKLFCADSRCTLEVLNMINEDGWTVKLQYRG